MALDSKYDLAAKWTRRLLTGDPDSPRPSDAVLELDIPAASGQLVLRYPCVGSDPFSGLTGDELAAWAESVGRSVASEILGGPTGATYAATVTEVKIGPVTKKQGSQASAKELSVSMRKTVISPLGRIACIRQRQKEIAASSGAFMGLDTVTAQPCKCKTRFP